MSNFKIGEKVVCIDDSSQLFGGLSKGEIYTINGFYNNLDAIYIDGFGYPHWSYRFRKLDHQFAEDICAELIADAKRETILN